MKIPEEPQTTSASESSSRPRASRVICRSEAAIVSPPNGISSASSRRTAFAEAPPGASCCAAAISTRSRGKRQSKALKAIAFVSTTTWRDITSPPARRSRATSEPGPPSDCPRLPLARLVSGRGRKRGVRRPLAPRACVERSVQAGDLQCQDVVAGVDTRATVDNRPFASRTERLVVPAQDQRRQEDGDGFRGQVPRPGRAPRTGDVAGARIDGLGLAAVSLGGPRIENEASAMRGDQLVLVHEKAGTQPRLERRGRDQRASRSRPAGLRPATWRTRRRARRRRRARARAARTTSARRPRPRRRRTPRPARPDRCPARP